MGLVTGLLLLPITGPIHGFRLFLERLRDEAEAVLHDEGRAFAELIDLSMRHDAGQLSDAEFSAQEAELLERLSSMRDYREDLLHGDREEDERDEDERDEDEREEDERELAGAEPDADEDSR